MSDTRERDVSVRLGSSPVKLMYARNVVHRQISSGEAEKRVESRDGAETLGRERKCSRKKGHKMSSAQTCKALLDLVLLQ